MNYRIFSLSCDIWHFFSLLHKSLNKIYKIDWCLSPTVAVFQLYRGIRVIKKSLSPKNFNFQYNSLENPLKKLHNHIKSLITRPDKIERQIALERLNITKFWKLVLYCNCVILSTNKGG